MPIYEYRCASCGHTLDALQKISDEPLKDCPECDESMLKRLVSAPAFRLKGGGWYETDFKSDKDKRRNLADGSGEAGKDKDQDKAKSEGGEKKSESSEKKSESSEKKSDGKKIDLSKKNGSGKATSGGGSEAA